MSPMTDIHDIRPPELFGTNPMLWRWAVIGLAALLLAGLAVWAVRRWRQQRRIETVSPELVLPPDQVALKRLTEIARLMGTDGRRFYFELSATLRAYLAGRFGIDALERTTEELVPMLKPLLPDWAGPLKTFLLGADPVKFAGTVPERPRMDRDLVFVREFVEKTTPPETEP
jgi:hypothetical protein